MLRMLGASVSGRWLAVLGLVANYCVMKWYAFVPVLTERYVKDKLRDRRLLNGGFGAA